MLHEGSGENTLENMPEKEKEPKVSYHFFFSPHHTAEDYKNLEAAFRDADIYVPEVAFWDDQIKKDYEGVAAGKLSPARGFGYNKATLREASIIYNSNKPIILVDLQSTEKELEKEFDAREKMTNDATKQFLSGNFDESIKMMRASIGDGAKLEAQREAMIKINLKSKINEFLKDNPKYKEKEELNVLVKLGAYHTRIYQEMLTEGQSVSREFSAMPFSLPYLMEAQRRIVFGKDLSDEIVAKSIIATDLIIYLMRLTNDSSSAYAALRRILDKFTLEDIKEISEKCGQAAKDRKQVSIISMINEIAGNVPKIREEFKRLLEKK